MPSYMKPGKAADYAPWVQELRASSTLGGRAVENWSESISDDTLTLYLRVTFAPLHPEHQLGAWGPSNWGVTETYAFPAFAVAKAEGK
jgi:hypothetical protein